ncbi:hypothetical protein PM8797T_25851 [Gimesia maris DSM 8797]|nr:hypothetical protein PM8797T_25851 [Gimesia maris DSM 8797]
MPVSLLKFEQMMNFLYSLQERTISRNSIKFKKPD